MNSRDTRVIDREGGPAGATPSALTFGLGSTSKICDRHLDRLAIVYIRQSSPQQVLENRESRERQYALAQLAQRLGWPAERVVIIDEDQARSGRWTDKRSGYQRLMTEVTLSHVGIVLGLEHSRVSRSNAEWHRLIDVCGIFHTLLCDQDGVYDALDSNDRLLLGMKSAMCEYELITMRNRLLRGSRNKAERGGRIGELEWRPPSHARILSILRHPIYAGAYAYGMHRAGTKDPATGRAEGGKWFVPPEEMAVLLPDRLPAYITWDRYRANLERLEQNRSLHDTRGVPRRGEALLPGLVVCGRCGHHMTTRYKTDKKPSYYCGEFGRLALDEPCGCISAMALDDLVAREVLRALEPAALDLSLRAIEGAERERKRLHDQWRQTLERARQEAEKAEREYHAVEPENRLVARTLEARWEEALKKQRRVEEDYHRFLARVPATLSEADRQRVRSLSAGVAALWHAPETTASDRKQIVRCVVERVIVVADRATELNEVTIVWHGGVTTRHQVARPVGRYEQLKDFRRLTERIKQLHQEGLHLAKIAARLNSEGFVPPRRRGAFTAGTIGSLVRDLGLVGELFRDELVGADEWWIPDLARELGVIAQKVHYWIKRGWVHARRTPSGKHLIVWADEDEIHRLGQLAGRKNSWLAARHPELVIPKSRPGR